MKVLLGLLLLTVCSLHGYRISHISNGLSYGRDASYLMHKTSTFLKFTAQRDGEDAALLLEAAERINNLYCVRDFDSIRKDFLKSIAHPSTLLKIYPLVKRQAFNVGFKFLLQRSILPVNMVDSFLTDIQRSGYNLQADTVNIYISYVLSKKNGIIRAEKIFNRYFETNSVKLTSRSINIMMECQRKHGDRNSVLRYHSLFGTRQLEPDGFTYSTLIRISTDADSVFHYLSDAYKLKGMVAEPLLSCAIETLGSAAIRNPAAAIEALQVQLDFNARKESNQGNTSDIDDAAQESDTSQRVVSVGKSVADSSIAALLSAPQERLLFDPPDTAEGACPTNVEADVVFERISSGCTTKSITPSFIFSTATITASAPISATVIASAPASASTTSSDSASISLPMMLNGTTAWEAAFLLALDERAADTSRNTDTENKYHDVQQPCRLLPLKCSGKGYCLLFTFLQREMRDIALQVEGREEGFRREGGQGKGTADGGRDRGLLNGPDQIPRLFILRDALWGMVKQDILKEMEMNGREKGKIGEEEGFQKLHPILNGRLVDAVMRCYFLDVVEARLFWRTELLPLLNSGGVGFKHEQIQDTRAHQKLDLVQKGLEVLLLLCGVHQRPDFGLEVARTISSRPWLATSLSVPRGNGRKTWKDASSLSTSASSSCLPYRASAYDSYCYGQRLHQQLRTSAGLSILRENTRSGRRQTEFRSTVTEFLYKGIENSLRLELMSPLSSLSALGASSVPDSGSTLVNGSVSPSAQSSQTPQLSKSWSSRSWQMSRDVKQETKEKRLVGEKGSKDKVKVNDRARNRGPGIDGNEKDLTIRIKLK